MERRKIGNAVGTVWHFFFLTDEQKERLDVYDTTGVDPASVSDTGDGDAPEEQASADDGPPADTAIPESMLARFADMYGQPDNT